MNKKILKSCEAILIAIGGSENILSLTHCVSRLRIVLKDDTKANIKVLEKISGVKSVFCPNNQWHIIIGTAVSEWFVILEQLIPQKLMLLIMTALFLIKRFKKKVNDIKGEWIIFLKFLFL